MKGFLKNQSGMTMVEIMIAAGLLGGLAIAGASLFKNQDKAQKTVESNYEVATTFSQIRGVLADITNCTASLGGQNINGGSVTFIKKAGVNVYTVGAKLPGNIQIKSYVLNNTLGGLAANETMLQITFTRSTTALQMDVVRSMKVVYTGGPTITSCYAYVNNSDSYWQLASNGSDIYYIGGNVGVGIATPTSKFETAGAISVHDSGQGPDPTYKGILQLTRPPATGQYINLVRAGNYPWSIGTVYNNSNFAIGAGQATDSNFTSPYFTIATNGYIGMGTPAPAVPLQVIGSNPGVQAVISASNASTDTRIDLINTTAGGNTWSLLSSGTGSGDVAGSFAIQNATTNLTPLVLLNNGNVGLGTTTPGYQLSLKSSTTSPYINLNFMGANMRSGILFAANNTNQYEVGVDQDQDNVRDFYIFDNVASQHRFNIISNGNVGIGTAAPNYKLVVSGDILSGAWLRSTGAAGWYSETYGGGWYMTDATWIRSYGSKAVYVDNNLRSDGELQVGGVGSTFRVIFNGDLSYRSNVLYANTAGNVGIGTAAPGYKLEVVGTIAGSSFMYTSDKTLKKDIVTIENPLDKITKMRGVYFSWKKDNAKDVGLIAQEVEKVEPRLVMTDNKGLKSVKYGNIIAIVIEAIKELKEMVMNVISDQDEIKAEQQKMWAEIKNLREENRELKQALEEKKQSDLRVRR